MTAGTAPALTSAFSAPAPLVVSGVAHISSATIAAGATMATIASSAFSRLRRGIVLTPCTGPKPDAAYLMDNDGKVVLGAISLARAGTPGRARSVCISAAVSYRRTPTEGRLSTQRHGHDPRGIGPGRPGGQARLPEGTETHRLASTRSRLLRPLSPFGRGIAAIVTSGLGLAAVLAGLPPPPVEAREAPREHHRDRRLGARPQGRSSSPYNLYMKLPALVDGRAQSGSPLSLLVRASPTRTSEGIPITPTARSLGVMRPRRRHHGP
jgi:hypothetical protein